MKLYADGIVYLQSYDLAFMITEKREIPMCIYQEIKAQLPEGTVQIDLRDEYNFAWRFQTIESVEWLMDCRYILDYGELRFCTVDDLDELLTGAYDTWYGLAMSCEGMPSVDSEVVDELQDFGQIIQSLVALIEYRQGQMEFPNLPEEYRAPVFSEAAEADNKYFDSYHDGFFPGFDRPIEKRRTQEPRLHRRLEYSRKHKL